MLRSFAAVYEEQGWLTPRTLLLLVLPWAGVLLYWLYYYVVKRRRACPDRLAIATLRTFYTIITSGASAGYDKTLLQLFHPTILQQRRVERGVLRAMARCMCSTLGPIEHIAPETVCVKYSGMQVNCVALVDFAKEKQIRCQLSWVRRLDPIASGVTNTEGSNSNTSTKEGAALPQKTMQQYCTIDADGLVSTRSFHVTGFHVTPPEGQQRRFSVAHFLDLDDFEPFVESFLEHLLLDQPPREAVAMMLAELQAKYTDDASLSGLQASIAKMVQSCGGLTQACHSTRPEVDATVMDKRFVTRDPTEAEQRDEPMRKEVIEGIEMSYLVAGKARPLEATVRLSLVGLRCCVTRYELRAQPDRRAQLLLDGDTGQRTWVE